MPFKPTVAYGGQNHVPGRVYVRTVQRQGRRTVYGQSEFTTDIIHGQGDDIRMHVGDANKVFCQSHISF